ncbi:MAG: hypothetical protein AAGF73_02820 [Actinomycetota bacterium]
MFEFNATEMVGYIASILVVVSFSMTSIVRLRVISFVGAVAFVVYAALIDSIPIMLTNVAIASIHVWRLRAEFAKESPGGIDLGALRIPPDSPFLRDFIEHQLDDIHRFQPDFERPAGDDAMAFLLLRDGLPVGLVMGRSPDSRLTIDLDYVVAAYRDSRLGRWLYGPGADVFRDAGIEVLRSAGYTDEHRQYLSRMGFTPVAHSSYYELAL